ncbi:TPA: hypothetical protein HA241_06445 [Candidatus Woesearchaeota archaeon]|nr:hypothetical protein [Candidatus Woesearchaeota archaeon]
MDKKIAILEHFFENPLGEFHIRELARLTKQNHMTVRSYLNTFVKEGLLHKKKSKLYPTYSANQANKKFINLKIYYNLEMIRESKLIEELEKEYDFPTIIIFGSYATATNTKESDIDIFILSDIPTEFNSEPYEKKLKRKISIHKFTEKEFQTMKTKNSELLNNICNGITLAGKLEVV